MEILSGAEQNKPHPHLSSPRSPHAGLFRSLLPDVYDVPGHCQYQALVL